MRSTLTAIIALMSTCSMAETIWVGRFPVGETAIPPPWRVEQIDQRIPATRYGLRLWDGVASVEAHASKSMALLGRPLDVDLRKTPILCWQWRVDAPVTSADMTRKAGDDYAARVYLTFDVPPDQLDLGTRMKLGIARSIYGNQLPDAALNYIWDNSHPVGTLQNNAYTDRARMLVLRSGAEKAGAWVSERRNVQKDFQRAFGNIDGHLSTLVLASDTDNTGEDAHAGFADFRFVTAETDCPTPSGE